MVKYTQLLALGAGALTMYPAATSGDENTTASSTNPLVVKGYRFFDSVSGDYFAFSGVNYYPRPNAGSLDINNFDFFTSNYSHMWQRDLPKFTALGANSIRLYAVDPTQDHDAFMCALQAEGIYVMVELGSSCEGCEITAKKAPDCYTASYKERGERIIQAFAKYDNVVGFSGGNEINHRVGSNGPEWNAPCQKKFIRDMRAYIKSCPTMRQIPVGVVMADTHRKENAQYYNCRTDPSDDLENVEWYGLNVYIQCDDIADPKLATGFNNLAQDLSTLNYSVPLILTEFGCLSPAFPSVNGYEGQRTHHDAKFMNMDPYTKVLNGGFVFEYNTEMANARSTSPYPFTKFGPQNYGLGYFSPANCDDINVPCVYNEMPNFEFLADAYKSTDTSSEPNFDSFSIEANRQQTSECPAAFPKLSAFTWASEGSGSIKCPAAARLQCPNTKPNQMATKVTKKRLGTPKNSSSSEASGSSESEAKDKSAENDLNDIAFDKDEKAETSSDCGSGESCGENNGKKDGVTETANLKSNKGNMPRTKIFLVALSFGSCLWAL